MKFSIVVPVYNARKYIEDCCESVFKQSYQNYELILVDDGSTDGSDVLCEQIAGRDPVRFVTIHTHNQGPLLARQTGIRAATGDVLIFLDSDDRLHGQLLEKLAQYFAENPCDIVLYNASKREDYSSGDYVHPFSGSIPTEVMKRDYLKKMVLAQVPNSLCVKAVARKCFESLPDFSCYPHVKNGEDLLLSLYLITAAQRILYLDETLYFYRQNETSIVHSYNPDRAQSIKIVHSEMERFIDLWKMPELHPAHYTREVKGWIETVLDLIENQNKMEEAALLDKLQAMSDDEYFRHAYEYMDSGLLSQKYKVLAKWLYRRYFFPLQAAGRIRAIKNKIR